MDAQTAARAGLVVVLLLAGCDAAAPRAPLFGVCQQDDDCATSGAQCLASPYGGGGLCTTRCGGTWSRMLLRGLAAAGAAQRCEALGSAFLGQDLHLSYLGACLPLIDASDAGTSPLRRGCCLVHHVAVAEGPSGQRAYVKSGSSTSPSFDVQCWIKMALEGYLVPYAPSGPAAPPALPGPASGDGRAPEAGPPQG